MNAFHILQAAPLFPRGNVKPASFLALFTKEQIERSGFLFGELPHARALRAGLMI